MASNKQNLDKDALVYLIEQIINGDEAVEEQLDGIAGEISPIIGRTHITDSAFEIIDKNGRVIATYGATTKIKSGNNLISINANGITLEKGVNVLNIGENIEIGMRNPSHTSLDVDKGIVVSRDCITVLNGSLRLPSIGAFEVEVFGTERDEQSEATWYRLVQGLDIFRSMTSNGWEYTVHDDGTIDATAIDTYTPTSGNTNFVTGLYYKDTTKSFAELISDVKELCEKYYDRFLEDFDYDNLESAHVLADANGNTGSGYITVWRASPNKTQKVINTRLVSTSASNMGTVNIAYTLHIVPTSIVHDDELDFE